MELITYKSYSYDRLAAMGRIYYSGKASQWHIQKYEFIKAQLLEELRSLYPEAKDGTAAYLHSAISSVLYTHMQEEKKILDGMRNNASMAHNQLLNFDLAAKERERK